MGVRKQDYAIISPEENFSAKIKVLYRLTSHTGNLPLLTSVERVVCELQAGEMTDTSIFHLDTALALLKNYHPSEEVLIKRAVAEILASLIKENEKKRAEKSEELKATVFVLKSSGYLPYKED